MTRWLAAGAFVLAMALYFGAAQPMQRQAGAAADEYRRARDERRDIRARLARLERREAIQRRAALAATSGPGEAVRTVRRAMVGVLDGVDVSGIRLGVLPAKAPVAATVRLSAEGSFDEVMRLCARMAGLETGVVLTQVRITPRGDRATVDIDAAAPGGAP